MRKYPTKERNCKTCEYSVTFRVIGNEQFDGYSCEKQKIYLADRTMCCCPKYSKGLTVEEWAEKNKGKPVSEWAVLPKDISHVQYSNGIVITTVENFEEMVRVRTEGMKR